MGILTVAVHCEAEERALHVKLADEAYCLGPPPASTSYLKEDKIVSVAKSVGAQAIHPGYGFLSENYSFADKCSAAGIEFVGPPSQAMRAMGSKREAKLIMQKAGVPTVPGYEGKGQDPQYLLDEACKIGFPVLIKATMGGGGRGMRVVDSKDAFLEALASAKRESLAAFSDETVILEKYLRRSRHVEVQVMADKHGNCVHLLERDCTVQRRHQKVIEEAPAPGLPAETRSQLGRDAVAAALAVGYVGAGTVEFLVDVDSGRYHFMEMNTRLQVEHPVTEMVTGLDLVRMQLEVAAGLPLPVNQEDIVARSKGHAIEARVYAERPSAGFLPATGAIRWMDLPAVPNVLQRDVPETGGVKVRIDTGVLQGDSISVHYDSMIAKLIVGGPTREAAVAAMASALSAIRIVGLPTNLLFIQGILAHRKFAQFDGMTTGFIAENFAQLLPPPSLPPPPAVALAAVTVALCDVVAGDTTRPPLSATSLRFSGRFFRTNDAYRRVVRLLVDPQQKDGAAVTVTLSVGPSGEDWTVSAPGWTQRLRVVPADVTASSSAGDAAGRAGDLVVIQGEAWFLADPADSSSATHRVTFHGGVTVADGSVFLAVPQWGPVHLSQPAVPPSFGDPVAVDSDAGGAVVSSPMSGKLVAVKVADGDLVRAGDVLIVMEAMKMETRLVAPLDGTVKLPKPLRAGQMTSTGDILAIVQPKTASP